jgi:hypothetical protein
MKKWLAMGFVFLLMVFLSLACKSNSSPTGANATPGTSGGY